MLLYSVPALEAFDASRGIDQPLLAGVKGMAPRANLDVQLADRRAGLESVPAGAGDHAAVVFGVNSGFHLPISSNSYWRAYHRLRGQTISLASAARFALVFTIITTIPLAARAVQAAPAHASVATPAPPAAAATPTAAATAEPGFAPAAQTLFAPVVMLAPPGPDRAARAIAILDRQLAFQRKISFHPVLGPSLEKVVDQLPPRQSTLIRAAALYSRDDIPWNRLKDGTHLIAVEGRPDGNDFRYSLAKTYTAPEEPQRMSGVFALRPPAESADAAPGSVIGSLGGELEIDTYGGGAALDSVAAGLREVRGDLKPAWDSAPGKFNHHDEAALARFHRDMPQLAAQLDHYLKYVNVLDEFDGGGDPVVLFNLDAQVRADSLKTYPNLYKFYLSVEKMVTAESAIYDQRGDYWIRTSFDRGHIRLAFMLRRGMLTPFNAHFEPGEPVAIDTVRRGAYRAESSVQVRSLGMMFGLERIGFSSEYTRDDNAVALTSKMNEVPDLVAPPVLHGMMEYIAGEFLRVLAKGHGGMQASFTSRRQGEGGYRLAAGMSAEFDYSPTLEFLARIGDAIADAHNQQVRSEERKFGEELFDAFVADYNNARPKILALDGESAAFR
jgi:hypothetical protein